MTRLVKVATVDEVVPGSMKTFDIDGRLILLANVDGIYYAMDAICTHADWDLSEGMLEGRKVVCSGHGAAWNLENGEAEFDEPLKPLKTYRTFVREGFVFVEMD